MRWEYASRAALLPSSGEARASIGDQASPSEHASIHWPTTVKGLGGGPPLADVLVEHAPECSAYSPYLGGDGDIGPRAALVGIGTPFRPFILCSGASPVRLVLGLQTTFALAIAAAASSRQPVATCRSRSGLY